MKKNTYIYLDYAATTPVDPRVLTAMLPFYKDKFGNSTSLHQLGQEAKSALDKSRQQIAQYLTVKPDEIIFTSSATESNNLALKGLAFANKNRGNHIIISSIEHDCILNSAQWLEKQGFKITRLPVDEHGVVEPKKLEKAITAKTILVSIMHANNEIGTIQPLATVGKICRAKKVYFHTDAAQTLGKWPIDIDNLHIDLLTASAHKMYGPKGAALLYKRKDVNIEPLVHGGGHESNLRSSTVNIAAIVGFAKAVELSFAEMASEKTRLTKLRNKLIRRVLNTIPDVYLNGHPQKRLPNNANFRFSFIEGEAIVTELDFARIAASTGSACASAKLEPSHVLLALGIRPEQAHGSLRISLGRWTKKSDIDNLLKTLPRIIVKLRRISPYKKKL